MNESETYQCSQCGKQDASNIRYLACGSLCKWEKNNYPAPITYYTKKNDIKIWKVALCDSCLPLTYRIFLQNRKRKAIKWLVYCFFFLIVAVGGIYLKITLKLTLDNYLLNVILSIALTISAFIGIIGIPISLITLITNSIKLRILCEKGVVTEKNKNKSFIGEGERIIKEMEKGIKFDFTLPKIKTGGRIVKSERIIIDVAPTLQELEKILPSEWQLLLKSSK